MKRNNMQNKLRKIMLQKYNNSCAICGHTNPIYTDIIDRIKAKENYVRLDLHHITPISKNGIDDPDNLILVCVKCHRLIHENIPY